MQPKSKRYLRTEYAKGTRALPRSLSFLEGSSYLAVIEQVANERTTFSVEVKPTTLKALLEAQKQLVSLQLECASAKQSHQAQMVDATAEISGLKLDLDEAESLIAQLRKNNAILLKRLDETPDDRPTERSGKSHMNRVQEKGLRPGIRGISGGLPSLGKRK